MSMHEKPNLDPDISGPMKEEIKRVRQDAINDNRNPDEAVKEFLRTIRLDQTADRMNAETAKGIEDALN